MTIDGNRIAWPPIKPDGSIGEHQPPQYRDFSVLREEDVPPSPQPSLRATRRRKGPKELSFPTKLHDMLTNCKAEGLSHIISWKEHGRCFVIPDPKQFAARIMPCYFRQSKFHSFQRQLNLYGFKRVTTGPDRGGYYHEMFLREKRFIATKMKRTKVKGVGRMPYSPDSDPDFYGLPFLPEIGGKIVAESSIMRPTAFAAKSEDTAVISAASSTSGGASVEGMSTCSINSSGGLSTPEPTTVASAFPGHFLSIPTRMTVGIPTQQANGISALRESQMTQSPVPTASDEVARSAQRILAEVKGTVVALGAKATSANGFGVAPPKAVTRHVIPSLPLPSYFQLPPPNEADMIMGALTAVAPYYNFDTNYAKSKTSQPPFL
ncbi:Heat stress transcription factor [Seminavis robusta]|uniref:Heat stress transcription factor n=1 Tax=Seminavis robusta TaxID=568900 RepID=A0A9N8HHQ5_9STRA|nr:Heat stress transcription factor [Seminavis robusta]|eukprot:Sro550_g164750.1 Heat stress transcription factor (378) ;mRNA; f:44171-45725